MEWLKKLMAIFATSKPTPKDEARELAKEILNRIGEIVIEHDMDVVKKAFALLEQSLDKNKKD